MGTKAMRHLWRVLAVAALVFGSTPIAAVQARHDQVGEEQREGLRPLGAEDAQRLLPVRGLGDAVAGPRERVVFAGVLL